MTLETNTYFVNDPYSSNRTKPIGYYINENGCHICTSHYRDKDGYPTLWRFGRTFRMNRYIYLLTHGNCPADLVVRHTCDEPGCINPDHLIIGTGQDNNNDKYQRCRQAQGESHGCAKLTNDQVREIKARILEQTSILAQDFGVSLQVISAIKANRRWKSIT